MNIFCMSAKELISNNKECLRYISNNGINYNLRHSSKRDGRFSMTGKFISEVSEGNI
jgi:hypothetical protein